ncbi:MAG: hypothetical protein F6K19_01410 [Cyanothece sp. SIO1E1]|nr:hypothetical protein [Cyanothece sp. SIO1E1]
MVEIEENDRVSARKLHKWLESKRSFSNWWSFKIEQADLILDTNFKVNKYVYRGNEYDDYHLTKDSAMDLALMEGTKKGKQVRDMVKEIFEQRTSGVLFNPDEILALISMVKACYIKEFRDEARNRHLRVYLPSNPNRTDYINANYSRNEVCGIDKEHIMKILAERHNKRNKSIEGALMVIDKHELIRVTVVDCMIALGKSEEFAINAGNLAKKISIQEGKGQFTRTKDNMYKLPIELEVAYKLLIA